MRLKQEKLLDELISVYLKDGEPIGSESLRLMVDMKISSATIRNYFKVFVRDGILLQPHVSSGRIPSNATLKRFWKKNLPISNCLGINSLENFARASKNCAVFCNIRFFECEYLREIKKIEQFIILIFDKSEAIVPYSRGLYQLLNDFIKRDIEEIKFYLKTFGANLAFLRLDCALPKEIYSFGYECLGALDEHLASEILRGEIYYRLKNGFCFEIAPDGYLGLIQDIKCENKNGKMLLFGALGCDFRKFYREIAS